MGYKRAGFDVIGNVEIDSRINSVYVSNFKPKYNFNLDLRDFNRLADLPAELYSLDILDGSPPCSSFSIAGAREKYWRVERRFNEGQKLQTLDDLFFVFLDTVEKLRPKIVIAENVLGLLRGNARGYVREIIRRFEDIGYAVQIFQLNSAYMDVPQARERVFFIANNQNYPALELQFNHRLIKFGEARTAAGIAIDANTKTARRLKHFRYGDRDISYITRRIEGARKSFNTRFLYDDEVALTLLANSIYIRVADMTWATSGDFVNISAFPQDYDFGAGTAHFICGMSVPPNMTANLAMEVYRQWL